MSNIINTALELIKNNLQPLYLQGGEDKLKFKKPAVYTWEDLQKKILTPEEASSLFSTISIRLEITREITKKDKTKFIAKGIKVFTTPLAIGIVTGAVSNSLEVIDVDTKHDVKGTLWGDLKQLLEDNLPELYNSLVIVRTQSGGYHIYYRCSQIEGSLKLATAVNNNVLVETKGEGGYIVAPPSLGYEFIQNNYTTIPTITPEQRELILAIARSFNEVKEEVKFIETNSKSYNNETSPFNDYNERGDILELLQSHGWKIVNQRGDRVNLLRPGATDTATSGNYHTALKVLRVFSSSTIFDTSKGYNNSQVFTILECNGDYKESCKKLLTLGYGEHDTSYKTSQKKLKVNSVNLVNYIPNNAIEIIEETTLKGIILTPQSNTETAKLELFNKISHLKQTTDKRIYIIEYGNELREYHYIINYIFNKYEKIEELNGELIDREKDNLIDEVILGGYNLDPIDKDIYLKMFLDNVEVLGINQQSVDIAIEKLTNKIEEDLKNQSLKLLLEQTYELEKKGEIEEALFKLYTGSEVLINKKVINNFNSLLEGTTEQAVKDLEALLPGSLNSGYKINQEELLLPGGAISVIAGATGHGKTLLLMNIALNVADESPDKKIIFFTYEERETAILQYFLNIYIDKNLNTSNYSNRRILKDYFRTGSLEFIKNENIAFFNQKKEEFFKTYIETGRILIKYVEYTAPEITLAIAHINKKEPTIAGIFIDYFQLLELPSNIKKEHFLTDRQKELKYICQSLKKTAKETGLPIVLAAQFNRTVTDLTKLLPTNIGEAGDIERIVNTLIGLWDLSKDIDDSKATSGDKGEIEIKTKGKKEGMFIKLMKSRDLRAGAYTILDYNGNTGKLTNSYEKLL